MTQLPDPPIEFFQGLLQEFQELNYEIGYKDGKAKNPSIQHAAVEKREALFWKLLAMRASEASATAVKSAGYDTRKDSSPEALASYTERLSSSPDTAVIDQFRSIARRADTIYRQTMCLELQEAIAIVRQHQPEVLQSDPTNVTNHDAKCYDSGPLQQREICLDEDALIDAMKNAIKAERDLTNSNEEEGWGPVEQDSRDWGAAAVAFNVLRPYLRTTEPVSGERWRPITEHPPEMEPVIAKTKHGTVGIAYVYKLGSEHPQWNFMAMGQNAMGLWDQEAVWMPLPN